MVILRNVSPNNTKNNKSELLKTFTDEELLAEITKRFESEKRLPVNEYKVLKCKFKPKGKNDKGIEEKILELKKEKLVKILRKFFVEKKIRRSINNPNSQYRSIYLSYNNWRKKHPKDFPSPRFLWKERDFQEKKDKILNVK